MNLLRFLFRYSRWPMIWTAAAAFLAGMCNAGIIAVVNAVLGGSKMPLTVLAWGFVALGAARILSNFLAQETLSHFAQTNTARIRHDLVQKILAVPLRQLEEFGAPRLMVALTEDLMDLTEAMQTIPTFGVNLAILLGGAIYLGYLSPQILLAMVVFIFFGAVAYRLLIRRGWKHLMLAREEQDRLFRHFRALTEGIKELKLHRERRGVFLENNVRSTTEILRRHNIAGELRFILANNWSQFLFFALIGLILFLLPKMEHINPRAMTGYVVATLYLMGPLSGVLSSLSLFGRASVGLKKIEDLGLALAVRSTDDGAAASRERTPAFGKLELVGVTHSYHNEKDDNHFLLGP
ncbi:MAG: ABC transporter ATP-binding protein, partial [Verrucomicrobiota bacterium]|nr:ABC transporter ATP-binding protein [Verrucomicrobiota bacterium]